MEMVLLVVAFVVFLLAGAIIAFSNRSTIAALKIELSSLHNKVNLQAKQISRLQALLSSSSPVAEETPPSTTPNVTPIQATTASKAASEQTEKPAVKAQQIAKSRPTGKPSPRLHKVPPQRFSLESFLKGNGLLWLGGLVLALGGIFLARYSIEAGLLPPELRVLMGCVFGCGLVVAAEYLARNKQRFQIHSPHVCAALASGGVITCYAMGLVAFDFYHFINAHIAFGLLALVSLVSTSLSLRFGPLLAWIGVIGAYTVPFLVSTGSNNVNALLLYTAFVSVSAIWIAQTVNQTKLWWLSFAANSLWLSLSISMANGSHFYAIALFCLFSIYLYVLSDMMGWKLTQHMTKVLPTKTLLMPRKEHLGLLIPVVALAIFLTFVGTSLYVVLGCVMIGALLCTVPARYSAFDSWPFIALLFALYGYTLMPEPKDYSDYLFPMRQSYLFAQVGAWFVLAYSAVMYRRWQRPAYLLLLVIGPTSFYAVSYALSPNAASDNLYPLWLAELLIIAISSAVISLKAKTGLVKLTLSVLANTCITLCCTMLLDAATLTLAIAMQIGVMSYLSWKNKVPLPDWLYKLALLVVTTRLTLAPWLDSYQAEHILGIHWTIVIYPIVLGVILFSRTYHSSESFKRWLEGAFIHILALLVTTETSYWLVGHYPNFFVLEFKEAALLAMNWFALSGVYLWRATLTPCYTLLCRGFGLFLLVIAGLIHLDISIVRNPFIVHTDTGQGLLINWLLILWAIPALIVTAIKRLQITDENLRLFLSVVSGVWLCFYVNGLIRGAFHDGLLVLNGQLTQAELYTYSIVWLLIATATVFVGQHKKQLVLQNIGFGVLALVLLKAFIVDMAHLEGLLRAMSFIGLGLSLVGIGWLFQRFNQEPPEQKCA